MLRLRKDAYCLSVLEEMQRVASRHDSDEKKEEIYSSSLMLAFVHGLDALAEVLLNDYPINFTKKLEHLGGKTILEWGEEVNREKVYPPMGRVEKSLEWISFGFFKGTARESLCSSGELYVRKEILKLIENKKAELANRDQVSISKKKK